MSSNEHRGLFENYRVCDICSKRLPLNYPDDTCPACTEANLLRDVKDYIRANDVNEYQVAEHFQIPLRKVKAWIREGRIEYRIRSSEETISGMHCQRCGGTVAFGTLCPKCLKEINSNIRGYHHAPDAENGRMRFLDDGDK